MSGYIPPLPNDSGSATPTPSVAQDPVPDCTCSRKTLESHHCLHGASGVSYMYAKEVRMQLDGVPSGEGIVYPSEFKNNEPLPLGGPLASEIAQGKKLLHHPVIPGQETTWKEPPNMSRSRKRRKKKIDLNQGPVRALYPEGNPQNCLLIAHDPRRGTTARGRGKFIGGTYCPRQITPQPPPTVASIAPSGPPPSVASFDPQWDMVGDTSGSQNTGLGSPFGAEPANGWGTPLTMYRDYGDDGLDPTLLRFAIAQAKKGKQQVREMTGFPGQLFDHKPGQPQLP